MPTPTKRTDIVYRMRESDVSYQLWVRTTPGAYDVQVVMVNRHEGYVHLHQQPCSRAYTSCRGGSA